MSIENAKIKIIRATEDDIPVILGFSDIYLRRDWVINRNYLLTQLKTGIILLAFVGVKIVGIGICRNKTLYLFRARINQTTGNPTPYYEKLGYKIIIPRDPKNRNICIMGK